MSSRLLWPLYCGACIFGALVLNNWMGQGGIQQIPLLAQFFHQLPLSGNIESQLLTWWLG